MLKRLVCSLAILVSLVQVGMAQVGASGIKGKILDSKSGEALPFVNVAVEKNGLNVTGGTTDFDGVYNIKPIPPGTYDLKVKYVGYKPILLTGVVVNANSITFKDIKMESSVVEIEEFTVVEYTVPLIKKDGGASGGTVLKEDITRMATRSAAGVAQTVGGVYSQEGSSDLSIRGARTDANFYYIDGIKVRGSNSLPQSSIEQISVITGGVPAQYGDVTGGVVNITTRGPSRKYNGGIEYNGSGVKIGDRVYGLDQYGYNLLEFSLTGPLLKGKDSTGFAEPRLGFFVAGNAQHIVESRPSQLGYWKVKDDVLEQLNNDPLRLSVFSQNAVQNAEFTRLPDFENRKWRPNVWNRGFNLQGKVDVNTGEMTNLTLGGNINFNNRRLTSYNSQLFNFDNLGERTDMTWRVFGRFVQRFGEADPDKEAKSARKLKNVYYTVQADYTQFHRKIEDTHHKDNLFAYGYIGEFRTFQTIDYSNTMGRDSATGQLAFIHETFLDTLIGFTPSDENPVGAAFTSTYYDIFGWQGYDTLDDGTVVGIFNSVLSDDPTTERENDFLSDLLAMNTFGGLRNGDAPNSVSNIWTSPASRYNSNQSFNNKQFRFTASGSADIGDHALSIGIEYEQRINRAWSVNPLSLWTLGRLYTNNHIQDLDKLNPVIDFFEEESGRQGPRITYPRLNAAPGDYNGDDAQFFFDYNLRNALGLDPDGTDYVDFDALSPDQLDINYFSADELLNQGQQRVSYYGYDHHGNLLKSTPSFDDFFTQKDDLGNFTRPIDAFRPIYMAGYVQDKFAFDDLIFTLGLRVDRYDANQQVLKDPWVLFPTIKAGEAQALALADGSHPQTIGDDFVVYVDDLKNPTTIKGYRDAGTWYNAEGSEIADGSSLAGATGIAPLLVNKEIINTTDLTSESFEDFKPITIPMPRIAFSFPISEEAVFTAHYDVLTRTPNSGSLNRLDPTDYLFLEQNTNTRNNPNLRPERTIDYEMGFQQVLSKTSSLKISAFYREMRDQIQIVNIAEAFPRQYRTYSNIDFGTVKGLTISYDLRRTGRISMRGSYTLQFAEGTGSNTDFAAALIRAGKDNLRVTNPLNFDQRHTFTGTVDYRYGAGKRYDGPIVTLFGKERRLLEATGANVTFNAGSGTPYSGQSLTTGTGLLSGAGSAFLEGSINGARLPWSFRTDLRIDKELVKTFGEGDKARTINFTVYFQILNLLNNKNIIAVYRATGNPTDDGYLADARFQNDIIAQQDEQSYRELYNLKISNPNNFNLPRQTRLGLILSF